MKFIYPQFLLALFAVAIPIIVHLFNFRKFKKVYFSNVRFLKEVKQETQSRSKLKHLLVLLSRILAITALVFAFAQPYIPINENKIVQGNKAVSIYIDNSFSMEAISKNGRLLDEALNKASQLINAYKSTDRFQLLTNDFEARHQQLLSKEDALELLSEIKPTSAVKNMGEIISRQADMLHDATEAKKTSYILSDFQKTMVTMDHLTNDSTMNVVLVPLPAQQNDNLYIDTCWFKSPIHQLNHPEELVVRIQNESKNALENIPLKLYVGKEQKALSSFNIEANSFIEVPLVFNVSNTGIQQLRAEITSYPIVFDDDFFASFETLENINILAINEDVESTYLGSLFKQDSLFKFTNTPAKSIDYSSLGSKELIILNGLTEISSGLSMELKQFVENGGNLLVFPSPVANITSYNNLLSLLNAGNYGSLDTNDTKIEQLNFQHPIYKDVFNTGKTKPGTIDLPAVNSHYQIKNSIRNKEESLMKLQNGESFMSKYDSKKGNVYVSCVPLNIDFSNFPKHAIFVPTLYNIALYSQPAQSLYYIIGKNEAIEMPSIELGNDNVLHVLGLENKFDIIPEHKIVDAKMSVYIHDQVDVAGNYLIQAMNKPIKGISFNYDRNESDLAYYSLGDLKTQLESHGLSTFSTLDASQVNFGDSLKEMDLGKRLWRLFLILALVFLGVEILLIRYWK